MNKNSKLLPMVNIASFIAVVIVNFLSNTLPLNGRTAGEISDALPSYFTPTGYTFSIWGVIYLTLLGFAVYQALPAQRQRPFMTRIGWLFAASSAANIAWLFAWHYGYYALSPLIMVSLLLTLIAIYLRLRIGHPDPALSAADRLFLHLPFSLYLGWITVATIANVASVAAYLGWDGLGISGPVWSAAMMLAAVLVAGLLLYRRRNLAYAAVLVWAFLGIRAAYPTIDVIATTALVATVLVAALALVGYARTQPQAASSPPSVYGAG